MAQTRVAPRLRSSSSITAEVTRTSLDSNRKLSENLQRRQSIDPQCAPYEVQRCEFAPILLLSSLNGLLGSTEKHVPPSFHRTRLETQRAHIAFTQLANTNALHVSDMMTM